MAGGYMGRILLVNLSTGKAESEPLAEDTARKYVGGYGLGAKVLLDHTTAGLDPLGPGNILGFTTGPLTGTPAIVGSRYTVVGKSPLTGGWGDANSGGYFGPALKKAGYDAVFFSGAADRPLYLVIDDGKASLRDASHLWGKDSNETEDILKAEVGRKAEIACVGQAGEKKALIACVMNNKGRAAGRSGLGAVMGARNLKAIAVLGDQEIPLADKELANRLRRSYLRKMTGWAVGDAKKYGTCGGTADVARSGDGPIKNWGGAAPDVPTVDNISDDDVVKYEYKKFACWRCVTGCGGLGNVPDGPYAVKDGHKPEYETLASFGFYCLNDNVESIWKANEICNRAGLDTISAGAVIGFAIECYENGILTKADTDGIELTWGNHAAIIAMLEKIARGEGLGAVLAQGVKRAAEQIGKGAERFAVHVGGQEPGMHDPKFTPGLALTFRVDATPARHTQGEAYMFDGEGWFLESLGIKKPEGGKLAYAGHGETFYKLAMATHFLNISGLCMFQFGSMSAQYMPDFMQAVTGWDYSMDEVFKAGERAAQARHIFNLREGINVLKLPVHPRILGQPPLTYGPNAGVTIDVERLSRDFAEAMAWNPETAVPSAQRLGALGIGDLAAIAGA